MNGVVQPDEVNMLLRRSLLMTALISGLFTTAVIAQPTSAPTTRTTSFPLTGVGSTETAQINVFNAAGNAASGAAASCSVTVSFLNSSGTTIGNASTFTLASDQFNSVVLQKPSGSPAHIVVRGVVSVAITPGVPCQLVSTLEVYDSSTGVDHSLINSVGGGPIARTPAQ